MNKTKKWFSFLEVLIVIMIVGILFVAFRSSFQVKNKDVLYGQACVETLYGQVNNFLYAGISSKSLFIWETPVFPDQYIISFDPAHQLIQLKYETEGSGYIYSSINIAENTTTYCSSNSYIIQLTWDTYQLYINKGLQENSALKSFYLSGAQSISTGESIFLQCDTSWTSCKTMARIESDTRTISIKKQICLSFSGNDCLEWDN